MLIDPNEPPIYGELLFELNVAPVSVQSKSAAKKLFEAEVRKLTRPLTYILTGDVSVEVEWLVHERARYESDASPDVDNVIKPLLDSFAGVDGLLIDDCQIRSVGVSWIDWTRSDQQLRISFRYQPDEWTRRSGLQFVNVGGALCLPYESNIPTHALKLRIEHYDRMFEMSKRLEALTGDHYLSRVVLPVQRLFHRTRIHGFPVVELSTLKAELGLPTQRAATDGSDPESSSHRDDADQ